MSLWSCNIRASPLSYKPLVLVDLLLLLVVELHGFLALSVLYFSIGVGNAGEVLLGDVEY